jgi:hypothetical protein
MSKEQLSAHTQTESAEESRTKDDLHGLPPYLFGQVMKLGPGDADALTKLLRLYPDYTDKILAAASPQVGLSTIKQAQAMIQTNAVGAAGSLGSTRPGSEFLDETATPTVPQVSGGALGPVRPGTEYLDETPSAAATQEPKPAGSAGSATTEAKPAQDEPWVADARRYNDIQEYLVEEFNDLTDYICLNDDSGKLDPKAVADWQRAHGLTADGKVGPHTVQAARAVKAKGGVAKTEQPEARIPV